MNVHLKQKRQDRRNGYNRNYAFVSYKTRYYSAYEGRYSGFHGRQGRYHPCLGRSTSVIAKDVSNASATCGSTRDIAVKREPDNGEDVECGAVSRVKVEPVDNITPGRICLSTNPSDNLVNSNNPGDGGTFNSNSDLRGVNKIGNRGMCKHTGYCERGKRSSMNAWPFKQSIL
ncbi:hypothetical protein BGZ83_005341 [Gryganskiella cystojenkinii]|nr:hypothetical protein BGZ83_005341 [Gryganskiella cystojenkinii]